MNSICPRSIGSWLTWLAGALIAGAASSDIDSTDHVSRFTNHWAFAAPQRPAIPDVKNLKWVRNPVDAFILARLEKERLAPSPEADRPTLIRRLSFDLIGLPPTPEEVDRFVADRSRDAYEKLVERLLASPHYGERWGRHWLDVVRFAESHGFEMNQPRKNAWRYRDYVIRAFNEDKPYPQFILEQLAGDACGADEATGFIVGGAWDEVKSPDIQLTLQQRMDELHDMVSTTGSAFLGLTVGCARCHDHKFDPISQRDYYAMQAVFAGVQHGERPLKPADHEVRNQQAEEVRRSLALLQSRLSRFEPLAQPGLRGQDSTAKSERRPPVHPHENTDRFTAVEAKFVRFSISATTDVEPCIDELEIYSASDAPRNVALETAGAKATSSGDYPNDPNHKLEYLNDGRYGNSGSWISSEKGKGWVQIELPQRILINKVAWGRDREDKYQDRLATNYVIEVATEPGEWKLVASSADRRPFVKGAAPEPGYSAEGLPPEQHEELGQLLVRKTALGKKLKELTTLPQAYAGKFSKPEPTHRLYRGDPMQKRETVAPGGPESFGRKFELPPDSADQERRLALARWLGDPENPLTARVLVNRLWHYHFGRGLVDTPSDFGRNGARPTHRELLDWLAVTFMSPSNPQPSTFNSQPACGWSLKALHRLIVNSATYRQGSARGPRAVAAARRDTPGDSVNQERSKRGPAGGTPAGAREPRALPNQIDPDDRLLWRFPPRRVEAEPLRDTILCVSGKLDLGMGGPGFDLFEPNSNYVHVYNPRQDFGPAEWRRMVYQSKPRMQLDDVFGAFDCPDGGQITPRRTSSTTALQALNLLNSSFILQQAGFFAERLQREAGNDPYAQVRRAFGLTLGRKPSKEELAASKKLIREHGLEVFCRAMFNANEFVYVF